MSSLLSSIRASFRPGQPGSQITHSAFTITTSASCIPSSFPISLSSVRHFSARRTTIVQKRALDGLYAGKHIQFGNSVSHSHHKTRRTWQPNSQRVTLFSHILQQRITLHATTHALRCIDKAGGLDGYIMGLREAGRGGVGGLVGKAAKLRERMEEVARPLRIQAEIEERLRRKADKLTAAGEAINNTSATGTVATAQTSTAAV